MNERSSQMASSLATLLAVLLVILSYFVDAHWPLYLAAPLFFAAAYLLWRRLR